MITELEKETFEKFENYVNDLLRKSEEKKMEKDLEQERIEMQTAKVLEDDSKENPFNNLGGSFVKLEKDKAKFLLLTNWKIETIEKFVDDKTGLPKRQKEFTADVLSEDGVACSKVFNTTSINCMIGLGKVFSKDFPRNDIPHLVRIKKIGEGKSTIWDVEEQPRK